jgi:hypothetical protein
MQLDARKDKSLSMVRISLEYMVRIQRRTFNKLGPTFDSGKIRDRLLFIYVPKPVNVYLQFEYWNEMALKCGTLEMYTVASYDLC